MPIQSISVQEYFVLTNFRSEVVEFWVGGMALKDKLRNIKVENGDATDCLQKKENKQAIESAAGEALAS